MTMRRMSDAMLAVEPYASELMLFVCSFWAAVSLWMAPNEISATYGPYFWMLSRLSNNSDVWAILTMAAAVAKAMGLLLCANRQHKIGLPWRVAGLAYSAFFWIGAGLSVLSVSPTAIGGIPMTLMGVSAWWTLIRYPAVPK